MQQKDILVNYMNNDNKKYPIAYACYNKDLNIRLQSTSGGIFTVLAEYVILELYGVVFGAAFDESYKVHHIRVDRINELGKLRGSKYPQSHMGNCYKEVKELLLNGKIVLFTGTPCQVNALHCFLNKQYDNLICMDFICHGVASPKIWEEYLIECKDRDNIQQIVFKDKIKGWKKWHIMIRYVDHTWYQRGYMNPFMKSYLEYANIRPSCFSCQFKGLVRNSDFTISDCWGVAESNRRINDNKGLSAFLIQNEKGEQIFKKIYNQLVFEQYNTGELMEGNWTTFKSVTENLNRTSFFKTSINIGTKSALNKFFKPTFKEWIRYYTLRLLGKEK